MYLKILNNNEREEVLFKLHEQFGITKLPFQIIKLGTDRLVAFSEMINEKELEKIYYNVGVEGIGLYLGKIDEKTGKIRLSIDATHLLKNQITKNIFELNEKQTEEWMKGHEINIQTGKNGFLVMRHKEDFLGTGKASQEKIGNFIPKERRLKEKLA